MWSYSECSILVAVGEEEVVRSSENVLLLLRKWQTEDSISKSKNEIKIYCISSAFKNNDPEKNSKTLFLQMFSLFAYGKLTRMSF